MVVVVVVVSFIRKTAPFAAPSSAQHAHMARNLMRHTTIHIPDHTPHACEPWVHG